MAEVEGPEEIGDRPGGGNSSIDHRTSHRDLLRWCGPGRADRLDAIVVPASRPAYSLVAAMELATAVGARLVAMCSGNAQVRKVAEVAREVPGLRASVLDLSTYRRGWLDDFQTSAVAAAVPRHLGDLSLKRNLGLLLGAAAGWRSLLFLDDDIRDVRPELVLRATAGLARFDAVGMVAKKFPDNSVVCHANRLAGGSQDVFVSGSAVVVDPTKALGFFPRVYNEDWLFFFDTLARGRLGATGTVRQLPYQPFADPKRAAAEEFGDILAEGLWTLRHLDLTDVDANVGYWREFLQSRRVFISAAAERLETQGPPGPATTRALTALAAAENTRANIQAEQLADYLQRWRHDLAEWRVLRARFAQCPTLDDGLAQLDLSSRAISIGDQNDCSLAEPASAAKVDALV
ncbi:hypothetical protein I6A60_04160 [Frankia sp. AgB1.9]|uniref:hypothetical protein n=1 Tax=unclassified Frankia TaxID=2632575 RepID=UPI0019340370|nr:MULTISPECIES: hypothetical protein [unclassified Frankia]MBL7492477.1 hypothetical protein [Frankia sp. AgW1.1]MBL7547077.1 hypothetical protein [Frankia sp. AgB1.9]MBL7619368.1 hypothetical protein [Frankia sp. AgB1.8]